MDRLDVERLSAALLEWAVMLLPLLTYLLYLAVVVNRQRRPVVVSGAADQALMLVGLSGFLLFGPWTWPIHFLRGVSDFAYALGYGAYLLIMIGLALGSIRRRRDAYVVYNVNPQQFVDVLRDVLKGLDIPYAATPGRIAWNDGRSMVDVAASYLGYAVTLRWQVEDAATRREIEDRLTLALKQVETEGNPAPLALLLLALVTFFVIVLGVVVQAFLQR